MIKPLPLLVLLALPAAAGRPSDDQFQESLQAIRQESGLRSADIAAIERTLVAMNDGVGAGEKVVAFIREKGLRIVVAAQAEPVRTDGGVISLSDALPPYPRVYGPLIASEVARRMFADMPPCAEQAYMRRATAGRVWLELGGRPGTLPVVEPLTGAQVRAIADEIGSWVSQDGAQLTLSKAGEAENLPELPAMLDGAKDPKVYADLAVANSRFVAFLLDERPFRQAAGLR